MLAPVPRVHLPLHFLAALLQMCVLHYLSQDDIFLKLDCLDRAFKRSMVIGVKEAF